MSNFSVHEVNRIELVGKCKPSHNYIDFFFYVDIAGEFL